MSDVLRAGSVCDQGTLSVSALVRTSVLFCLCNYIWYFAFACHFGFEYAGARCPKIPSGDYASADVFYSDLLECKQCFWNCSDCHLDESAFLSGNRIPGLPVLSAGNSLLSGTDDCVLDMDILTLLVRQYDHVPIPNEIY